MRLIDIYGCDDTKTQATEYLYKLIAERLTEPELNISGTMPTLADHVAFVKSMPYRAWFMIEHPSITNQGIQTWVGYVSATQRNEIGIVLEKAYRGRGLGPQALLMFMDRMKPLPAIPSERSGHWIANINPANARSIATFEHLGFRHIQNTYELPG